MKIWFRLSRDSHTIKDMILENNEDISRTAKVFALLEEACHVWDLAVPVWLEPTIHEFKYRAKARFPRDSFHEAVDFDYMEIQVLEE